MEATSIDEGHKGQEESGDPGTNEEGEANTWTLRKSGETEEHGVYLE